MLERLDRESDADKAGGDDVGQTTQSCPAPGNLMGNILSGCGPSRVKITLVKVIKLTFKTDHHVMKDNNSDWKNSGNIFSKPEWTFGNKSNPVSHNKNSKVTVEVVFDVYPRDAGSTACTVKGKAGFGSLEFSATGNIQGGGSQTFTATTTNTLPDNVAKLTGDIDWTVDTTDDGSFPAGASWGHTVYVTLGDPFSVPGREEGITQKRMETAVREITRVAPGSNDPHLIIQNLLNIFQGYTLVDAQPPPGVSPVPVGPWTFGHCKYFNNTGAWPLIDFVSDAAQCQAIVRFVRAAAKQVGCPGDAKIMLVYATPLVNDGNTVVEDEFETVNGDSGFGGLNGNPGDPDPAKQNHPAKTVNGKPCEAWLFDRPGAVVGKVFEPNGAGPTPPPIGPNNYEACLKFTANGTTKYYGGGMPNTSFATKELVLSGAFPHLVWVSFPPTPPGHNDFMKVEKIIRAAPW